MKATMDDTYPLAFRLGIPKPLSCKVLKGEPKVGNTRQCTTDKGYIQQDIVELVENTRLVYQMKDSNIWCKDWVSFLQDSFMLQAIDDNKTQVTRITEFKGVIYTCAEYNCLMGISINCLSPLA